MMGQQAAISSAIRMAELGETTEPNVEATRMMGVRIIRGKLPRAVRAELNKAVKSGRLGHLKKNGLLPEAYFHPNSLDRAKAMRNQEAYAGIQAIKEVCVSHSHLD